LRPVNNPQPAACALHKLKPLTQGNKMNATVQSGLRPVVRPSAKNHETWVIVSAYNESARLADTLRAVCERFSNVVVVDDGSEDDTNNIALRFPVWVLRHIVNSGQGAALQTGLTFALGRGAAVLVTFDGDGQHSPDEIERLVKPVREGTVDVALGSRFLGRSVGMPWGRWLVLKLGVLFTRVFSWVSVTDTHNGLRALSRQAALQLRITHNRMAHASEILDQIRERRLRYCEVPVTIRYSGETVAKGQSSWNALRILAQLFLGRLVR
jgi:glycosyltransferase involved in cell wall biosynthesis